MYFLAPSRFCLVALLVLYYYCVVLVAGGVGRPVKTCNILLWCVCVPSVKLASSTLPVIMYIHRFWYTQVESLQQQGEREPGWSTVTNTTATGCMQHVRTSHSNQDNSTAERNKRGEGENFIELPSIFPSPRVPAHSLSARYRAATVSVMMG